MLRRLILLTVLFVFCLSSAVSAGTMDELLIKSIQNNDLKMVKTALANGADINYKRDKYARTPLCEAIAWNNIDLVKFLIENGADINLDYWSIGMTGKSNPLFLAVCEDNIKLAQFLIGAGANVNFEGGHNDETPLIIAVDSLSINPKMVAMLLVNKVDPNKSNKYGMTPLMVVANRSGSASTNNGFNRLLAANILLECGADPNMKNNYMRKPLDFAIEHNFVEMIELLLPITKK